MTDARIEEILPTLDRGDVEFIVIGGAAAMFHGSARLTHDVDVVYRRSDDNIARLVATIAPLKPYLRGAPPGLPFRFDAKTVRAGLNFTLETTLGDLDLLGEVSGGGGYDALLPHTVEGRSFGAAVRYVDLPTLIHLKRAAGRAKDLEAIAELEKLRLERQSGAGA